MNLFGKKKVASGPIAAPVDAIRDLRNQLLILEKRENLMQQRINQAVQEAIKKKNSGDTKGYVNFKFLNVYLIIISVAALFELKRKKMFEAEVSKLQGARITLDSQIMALESASINMETVKAMKVGADAMKNIHGNLDADKVDDLLDSIQEQKEIHDTISEAISRPGQDMFDDEQLLSELAELDLLEEKASVNIPTPTFELPLVPDTKLTHITSKPKETDEEREIRELESSMLA